VADFGVQQIAGTTLPLLITSGNTFLQDADPVMYFVADYLGAMINTYAGARFVAEVSTPSMGLGASQGAPLPITAGVGTVFTHDPRKYLLAGQFNKFPLLALYRMTTQYEWKRIGWETDKCAIGLDYVMPPLTTGQIQVASPMLRAVEMIVRHMTAQSFDPTYTPPGGLLGQSPFGAGFANLEEIGWDKGKYGMWEGPANSLGFAAVHMEGFVRERDMLPSEALSGRVKFAGADVEHDLTADDQTTIAPFVNLSTYQAPTVTSVSPAAGGIAGGTSVTLTGTLFLQAPSPRVYFGNLDQLHAATNVSWVNATTITCTSPAVSGPGTLPVTVVNGDTQIGSLKNAFTYS
jgi:hypothetical protein